MAYEERIAKMIEKRTMKRIVNRIVKSIIERATESLERLLPWESQHGGDFKSKVAKVRKRREVLFFKFKRL